MLTIKEFRSKLLIRLQRSPKSMWSKNEVKDLILGTYIDIIDSYIARDSDAGMDEIDAITISKFLQEKKNET